MEPKFSLEPKYDLKSLKKKFAEDAIKYENEHKARCERHLELYGEPHPFENDTFNLPKAFIAIIEAIQECQTK